MKYLEKDSEKKFNRSASWGRGLMALLGLPKRAIKPRSQLAFPRPYLTSKERNLFLFYFGGLPLYTFN